MGISGVKSSNTLSSLMNSTNTISGLASGMDTESMIEGLVKSYQTKITQLGQQATKIEWKQDAYRSIISKMVGFSNNYASYTSGTNLLSSSFFSGSVNVDTTGKNAEKVSASGKTSSEIVIDRVSQLASAARYSTASKIKQDENTVIKAAGAISLSGQTEQGTLNGSLSLVYGSKVVSISFDPSKDKVTGTTAKEKADSLAKMINEKLADQQIALNSGAVSASDRIKVSVGSDGTISFADKSSAGNSVYINGASDSVKKTLGLGDLKSTTLEDRVNSFKVKDSTEFTHMVDNFEAISGKQMNVNLDGTVKQIKMPTIEKSKDGKFTIDGEEVAEKDLATKFTEKLSAAFQKEFGDKIKVENLGTYDGKDQLRLQFKIEDGSSLLINADSGDMLGIGKTATSYLNTNKTLEELMGEDAFKGATPSKDKDGKEIEGKYDLVINGETIGSYGKDTKLSTIMSDINANSKAGVKVSFSQATGQFLFTTKETGSQAKIDMAEGLAQNIFGSTEDEGAAYTAGDDAKLHVTINGVEKELTRSSNNFTLDGLNIALKDTFNADKKNEELRDIPNDEKVGFKTSVDSDKIVDAVKSMITDYNEMMAEIKSAYSTLPYQDSTGDFKSYEPLTEEDKAGMSESAIERYEEKAKQGILFGDYNLSSLYRGMQDVFNLSGADGSLLNRMGISQSFSSVDGSMSITLDEKKLREVLETDPDSVAELFTKSKDSGASSNGIMQNMKTQLDRYAGLTGAVKGVLVQEAGTPLSSISLLNNNYQKQLENINTQIEKWQDKLSDRVDYYTNQFTRLELLINQMNSQSSTLAGLMGGG